MPTINISYTMTEEKVQNFIAALGYQEKIPGTDESGNPVMIDNPTLKTAFIEQEVMSMLKEKFAYNEIQNIEESYRQQIETEKKTVLDEIEANTTVNLV